jgi:hypothetical protein
VDAAVKTDAALLLKGIRQDREICDDEPLISEIGKRKKTPVIFIHDAILLEIANAIRAERRGLGGRDD